MTISHLLLGTVTGMIHFKQAEREIIISQRKTAQEQLSAELIAKLLRSKLNRINDYSRQISIDKAIKEHKDSLRMAKIEVQQIAAKLEQQKAKVRQDSLARIEKARTDCLKSADELRQLREERIEYLNAQRKMQQQKLKNERRKILKKPDIDMSSFNSFSSFNQFFDNNDGKIQIF